jgi:hypothetical protein
MPFPSPGEAMQQIASWEERAGQMMRPTCDHPARRFGWSCSQPVNQMPTKLGERQAIQGRTGLDGVVNSRRRAE